MLFLLLHKKIESKEQEHPHNICGRFYDFLVKLLATQALKKVALGDPSTLGTVERKEQNSDIASNMVCDVGKNIEKNEVLSVDGEQLELRVPKEKAPRKIVSIKEEVDKIPISSKRIKRKTSKGSFGPFEHEVMPIKPLKSILRKNSGVSNNL
ncbi:hypothetical protein EUTSA_v10023959mg [Eutrema salsugineum]|uniref:Uncharacterized protein n=1 Tax=Eutrema salsugineum TaxID=72664 RepID=V4KEY3_EUTSA|nr:uncharacterized protein LOC18010355 [Eutrema salsugineum]ESQ29704.1 hypothetical protein EUTSA_v10023959mg [Eutrema salsugineum]